MDMSVSIAIRIPQGGKHMLSITLKCKRTSKTFQILPFFESLNNEFQIEIS